MGILDKAKDKAKSVVSSIGDETVAEVAFDKEPEEKRPKKKKERVKKEKKKPRPKKSRKPEPVDVEDIEEDEDVDYPEFDTFSDYSDLENNPDDYLEEDYEEPEEDYDEEFDEPEEVAEEPEETEEDYDESPYDDYEYEYEDETSNNFDDADLDDDEVEEEDFDGAPELTYQEILEKLGISEKVIIPDDVILHDDAKDVSFDYQLKNGLNVSQVREFQKVTVRSLSELVKIIKKRNLDVVKLAEFSANTKDSSQVAKRNADIARKIQKDKNYEIAKRNNEISRLKELVNARTDELKFAHQTSSRNEKDLQKLQDRLTKMNDYVKELGDKLTKAQEQAQEKDKKIAQQQESYSELQQFNDEMQQSLQIISQQKEAREQEEQEREERERQLKESQEKKLLEKIVVYENEEDENIIRDMMGVKNLISERDIQDEITINDLEDKDILSDSDISMFHEGGTVDTSKLDGDIDNTDTIVRESEVDHITPSPATESAVNTENTENKGKAVNTESNANTGNDNNANKPATKSKPQKEGEDAKEHVDIKNVSTPAHNADNVDNGEDVDLEDSMNTLASGTTNIDYENDLSAESSQEYQERQLLDSIDMIDEDSREELDMNALSSMLKDDN